MFGFGFGFGFVTILIFGLFIVLVIVVIVVAVIVNSTQTQKLRQAQAELAVLEGKRLSGQPLNEYEAIRLVTLQQTVQEIRDQRYQSAIANSGNHMGMRM